MNAKRTQQRTLPVLPLRDVVVFPYMVMPLFVGRAKSISALDEAMNEGKQLLLVSQKQADLEEPTIDDVFDVGTIANIIQLLKLPDGTVKVLVEGQQRAKINQLNDGEDHFSAEVTPIETTFGDEKELDVVKAAVLNEFENYLQLNKKIPADVLGALQRIDDADRFGLSQLYQIRGRVGRREKIAYCYLLIQPQKELTEQAHKRLKAIKEFTSLGSGYKVAMRDLTIRGAGDMLGPQQAGFIDDVGLDLYLEMLASAIKEKQGKPMEDKKNDKVAQVQLSGYIPEKFTDNDGDKLEIYQHIKKTESLTELIEYEKRVEDLFGHIPNEVKQLFEQKKLDFFVNREGVESLKETDDVVIITMSAEWSKNCDGVKLFGAINDISRKINLKLESGKIKIMISKRLKKHIELMVQVIDKLEGEF